MTGQRPDHARPARTLYELSSADGHGLDPADLVKLVADQAQALLHGDGVAVYVWDDAAELLVPVYANDPRQLLYDEPLRAGQGACGQALQRRQTVIVDDYATFEHAVATGITAGLRAIESVPLMLAEQAVGVLAIRFYGERPVKGADEERMLGVLAALAAPALEAARLYATSKLGQERERALREITSALAENLDERLVLQLAVHRSAELLRAPYARVWLLEPSGELSCAAAEGFVHANTFSRRLAPESTSGIAARQQIVSLTNAPAEVSWHFNREFGERTGLGAYLGAGLWRAGESLGVLEVMREVGHRFSRVEEQLLLTLANAVAVAVSNARTHAAAEQLAQAAQQRAEIVAASERALQRRDAILQAVAFAAEQLLTSPDWEQSIGDVLRELGLATGMSRVYIVPSGASVGDLRRAGYHEWTAEGVPRRTDIPANGLYFESLGLDRWQRVLREGGILQGQVHSFPPEEQVALASQDVRSVVLVPIFLGATWWGFIGFDDCAEERTWQTGLVEALKTAAGTLGAAILRRRAEAERLQLVREQAARVEAEAAQRRLAYLAEASQMLAASFEYETSLQGVADLLVPGLADGCLFDLSEPDGSPRRVAAAGITALGGDAPEPPIARVIGANRTWLSPRALSVPLATHTGVAGALTWLASPERPAFDTKDLDLALHLARRCAVAIDNARLYHEARAAVSLRDEFLSVAAHELKTPMTSLRGYAQLLAREFDRGQVKNADRARRAAETIQLQSDKLARLVAQLLDVSRLQSGKLAVERTPVDLAALLRDVVEAARAQLHRHTLVARLPVELWASIDPLRIEQVVTNLIDNAIKYSPEGGQIDVGLSASPDNTTAQITIRDRGLGVPPEHRAHIFDRFYQAHAGGALTSMAGMGLGLYISREIVELHHGTITAEFPDDGGTRFIVSLPLEDGAAVTSS